MEASLPSDWSTITENVCPTKRWVYEQGRPPTTDCEVAIIGVSLTKFYKFSGERPRFVHVAYF